MSAVVLWRKSVVSGLLGMLGLLSANAYADNGAFDGEYTYEVRCGTCHGMKGEGINLFGPPLRGNAFITHGDAASIAETIHKGRKGEMKRYPDYPGMPRFQYIRAGELRALIDHLKTDLQR